MGGPDPFLEPGALVRHPTQDDWGVGQVQSIAGRKVTVNFEHAGKQVIDSDVIALVFLGDDPRGAR
jgi:FKBP-type peptidyl-prolyl cis-trans isomerase 2